MVAGGGSFHRRKAHLVGCRGGALPVAVESQCYARSLWESSRDMTICSANPHKDYRVAIRLAP